MEHLVTSKEAKTVIRVSSGDVVLEITIAAYLRGHSPEDKPLVVLK